MNNFVETLLTKLGLADGEERQSISPIRYGTPAPCKESILTRDQSYFKDSMKDISVLEQRIQRLEYYTTLNLLEKVALQTTIADDNGEARFQNGFFVDPFNSHIYGRTSDPSYRAAIDERSTQKTTSA